jgi:hypothetical protein
MAHALDPNVPASASPPWRCLRVRTDGGLVPSGAERAHAAPEKRLAGAPRDSLPVRAVGPPRGDGMGMRMDGFPWSCCAMCLVRPWAGVLPTCARLRAPPVGPDGASPPRNSETTVMTWHDDVFGHAIRSAAATASSPLPPGGRRRRRLLGGRFRP